MPIEDNMLNVLLTEYNSLREELKSKFINQITIFGIIVSALGITYSLSFNDNGGFSNVVLLIPFITIPLGLKAQHSNYGVMIMGEYLTYLETLIQKHFNSNNWCGWQNYWNVRSNNNLVFIHDALSKYLIYFVIPVVIAIIYLFFIDFALFILYSLMMVGLGLVFCYYKKRLDNDYELSCDRFKNILKEIYKISGEKFDGISFHNDKIKNVEKIVDEIKKIQDLRITNYPDILINILLERYAKGEITKKEFEQMKKDIEGFKERK